MNTPRYCACGCGKELNKPRKMSVARFLTVRFVHGHGSTKPEPPHRLCACGCGQALVRLKTTSPSQFAKQAYIKGHHHKNKACMAKRSESLKAAYRQGKMQHAVHQTPEFIEKRIRTLRGRKHSEQRRHQLSEGIKKAWEKGCYHTATAIETRKKHLCRVGASPKRMDELRAMVDKAKLAVENSEKMKAQMKEWKASGKLDEVRRKAGNGIGMLDHISAKVWIIRDPRGKIYKFSNLREWARNHHHLFEDDRPESRAPFWRRIADGMAALLAMSGRSCSYRGWTAVSKLEIDQGGVDLLGRDYFTQHTNPPTP